MAEDATTFVAIHLLSYQGKKALAAKWPAFLDVMRNSLSSKGVESADASEELFLFEYPHPSAALSSVLQGLDRAKQSVVWSDSLGDVPLQIVIHLEKSGEKKPVIREASASLWDELLPGKIYINRLLKVQWQQFMAGCKLPPLYFEDEGSGFSQVCFPERVSLEDERIAPDRKILLRGNHRPCFYCGMTNHAVGQCPSKFLTVEAQGIKFAGYLSFSEFRKIFQEVFSSPAGLSALASSGADVAKIRKNSNLCVFGAFFDINLIYQPRFLLNIAFSLPSSWNGSGWGERVKVDSNNVQMGLDCLRVGQYAKARKMLLQEHQILGGKQFYANVGLALVALEEDRGKEMLQHLELARGLANSDKERIYISLLLSRYHELEDAHLQRAEQVLQPLLNLFTDCAEAQYRKLQIFVKQGEISQGLGMLRNMAEFDRRIFMAALMDPFLLPIEGMIDDVLADLVRIRAKVALENLTKAREDCEKLKAWFDNEDEGLVANLTTIAKLEKQYERRSYFDLLDVAQRAKVLSISCPQMRETQLDALNEKVDDVLIEWDGYKNFWKSYPYKCFFKNFNANLLASKRNLVEARSKAGKNLRQSLGMVDDALKTIGKLKREFQRMNRLKMFLNTTLVFVKKLLVSESVLSFLAVVLYLVVTVWFADSISDRTLSLLTDTAVWKKSMLFINLFVAPLVSFAMTISTISDD